MVNAEAREKDVKAAEAELKVETGAIEKEKEEARRVTAEDEKKLTEWNGKRDGLRGGVSADLLRHYERVSKFRGSGLSGSSRPQMHGVPGDAASADLQRSPIPDSRSSFAIPANAFFISIRRARW